ncbi:hypothetical protein AB0K18_43005 [Nonomuraea sp. NPDC049421]|uniref:hypothetical protein n=1 Tax=Nonomuraea sp. NPDC049421 TaxID=3155275 RepID=UPI00342E108A
MIPASGLANHHDEAEEKDLMTRKPSPEGLTAAENTLGGALRTGSPLRLAEYVRIALEAAQPYEDEARNQELADRLEGQGLRVSASTHFHPVADGLATAIQEAMNKEIDAGEIPIGTLLAQVAYLTIAQMLREGRL